MLQLKVGVRLAFRAVRVRYTENTDKNRQIYENVHGSVWRTSLSKLVYTVWFLEERE